MIKKIIKLEGINPNCQRPLNNKLAPTIYFYQGLWLFPKSLNILNLLYLLVGRNNPTGVGAKNEHLREKQTEYFKRERARYSIQPQRRHP